MYDTAAIDTGCIRKKEESKISVGQVIILAAIDVLHKPLWGSPVDVCAAFMNIFMNHKISLVTVVGNKMRYNNISLHCTLLIIYGC